MKFEVELELKEQGNKLSKLEKDLNKISRSSNNTQKSFNGITKSIKSMVGALAGYIAVSRGISLGSGITKGIIETASAFEDYKTILVALEGSNRKAEKDFEWIKDFAKTTPFEIDKVTESFVRMKSYGLDTSGLKIYGDTAAAMGKDITQVVEAMADAMTGENERLKELGITASVQGDKIGYSWINASGKAKSIVIDNNKEIVQSTLQAIFNSKYEGSMDKLSKTYTGLMSNLKDSYTNFQNEIAQKTGIFDNIKESIKVVIDSFKNLKPDTESLQAYANLMKSFIISSVNGIAGLIKGFLYFKNGINTTTAVLNDFILRSKIGFLNLKKYIYEGIYALRKFKEELSGGDYDNSADAFAIKQQIKVYETGARVFEKQRKEGYKNWNSDTKETKKVLEDLNNLQTGITSAMSKDFSNTANAHKKMNEELAKKPEVAGAKDISLKDNMDQTKGSEVEDKSKSAEQQLFIQQQLNASKLESDLNYYTLTKQYEQAKNTELQMYKDELANSDYSELQRKELLLVKLDELKNKYAEIKQQELDNQTTIAAGFNSYMNNLQTRMTDYSAMTKSIMNQTESLLNNSLNSVFDQMSKGTISFKDTMKQLTDSVLQMIQQMITKMIVMKVMSAAFGGGGFGGAFANGAAFEGGSVKAFATGGVVSSPTYFPMSGGKTGLMGEAGPEAIMPLAKNSKGQLGVRQDGSASKSGNIVINNHSSEQINAEKQSNGDTVITVGMIEQIDKMLASRVHTGHSETDKVFNKKYEMEKN